jgi:IS605 OrfB family transposase
MIKTYSLNLVGNKRKMEMLKSIFSDCQEVSDFILGYVKINKEYRITEIHKNTYFILRNKYPKLNSKLFQQVRDKILSSVKNKKLKKTKKVSVPIILDYQSFNLKFEENDKYFNCFLRFFKTNFPLEGKRIIEKLKKVNKIKRIEIIPKDNFKYFKVFFNCEVDDIKSINSNKLALDINLNNIYLSDGKKFNLKLYIHKKLNYRKHKDIKYIENWSKGYIRSLTSDISKYLFLNQIGYLVIEDLKNIRKSFSKKLGTSKGKNLNYLINNCFPYSMFSNFLENSCSNLGILVEKINPAYTSKTCSNCGSLNTSRPKQNLFVCNDCHINQNADLNGAKNILLFSQKNLIKREDQELNSLNKTFEAVVL